MLRFQSSVHPVIEVKFLYLFLLTGKSTYRTEVLFKKFRWRPNYKDKSSKAYRDLVNGIKVTVRKYFPEKTPGKSNITELWLSKWRHCISTKSPLYCCEHCDVELEMVYHLSILLGFSFFLLVQRNLHEDVRKKERRVSKSQGQRRQVPVSFRSGCDQFNKG